MNHLLRAGKYAVALKQVLTAQGEEDPAIEVVFVIGHPPKVTAASLQSDKEYIRTALGLINGRILTYNQLINNALAQYEEYLTASAEARRLEELLGSIEQPRKSKDPGEVGGANESVDESAAAS